MNASIFHSSSSTVSPKRAAEIETNGLFKMHTVWHSHDETQNIFFYSFQTNLNELLGLKFLNDIIDLKRFE